MDIKKKFKIANIGLAVLTILFMILGCFSGVKTLNEKKKQPIVYNEKTTVSYLVNDTYTEKDNLTFAASEVDTIDLVFEYFNNNKNTRGEVAATVTTFIKIKDISEKTVYGAFGEIDYIQEATQVNKDTTTITYTVDYDAYEELVKDYFEDPSNGLDAVVTPAGKVEVAFIVTDKAEKTSRVVVSMNLLEDTLSISLGKNISKEETIFDSDYKLFLFVTLGCCCAVVGFAVCLFISYKLSKMNDYDRRLLVIFKLNKGILVESDLSEVNNGFVVNSFSELLKVQNSVSLPILYSKSDTSVRFAIKAGNSVYSYTISK